MFERERLPEEARVVLLSDYDAPLLLVGGIFAIWRFGSCASLVAANLAFCSFGRY